ncbi:MAG: hypothetical protein K6F83_06980 [Clostridiales bacterium]|nr:hypothetical protein [Clostridiales bacterium]
MEMWNKRLERDNLTEFYNETIEMVYPSTYQICKETTRTEQAIVKSYVDVFQQRQNIPGDEVLYVFGDILLKNANDIVEKYELPEGLTFGPRNLDEYTRNSMLEKINTKIDSKGFKVAEFISSDAKKIKSGKSSLRLNSFSLTITPLLVFYMVVLALLIWGISYAAITLPYRNNALVSSKINDSVPLQEKYVSVLDYLPLGINFINSDEQASDETDEPEELAPSFGSTEPTATKG